MATRKFKSRPDLPAILAHLFTARCVLECAVRSLEEWHDPSTGTDDEAACLRHGLDLLGLAYEELDLASMSMPESSHA